jgi:hypothetical protein
MYCIQRLYSVTAVVEEWIYTELCLRARITCRDNVNAQGCQHMQMTNPALPQHLLHLRENAHSCTQALMQSDRTSCVAIHACAQ